MSETRTIRLPPEIAAPYAAGIVASPLGAVPRGVPEGHKRGGNDAGNDETKEDRAVISGGSLSLVLIALAVVCLLTASPGAWAAPSADERKAMIEQLCQATQAGNLNEVRRLVKSGADVNGTDKKERTPLSCAVAEEKLDILRFLLGAKAHVDQPIPRYAGATAFVVAASTGNLEIIKELVSAGANPKAADAAEQNALHWAARVGKTEAVKLLISLGVPINQGKRGGTPINQAAMYGQDEAIRVLIRNGADLTKQGPWGLTALALAAKYDRLEVVRVLIDAMHGRRMLPLRDPEAMVQGAGRGSVALVDALLAAGGDPNSVSPANGPALLFATEFHRWDAVRRLLKAKVNVNARHPRGPTFLHMAIADNVIDVAQAAIAAGADIEGKHALGVSTPLIWAIERHYPEMVRMLLAAGADPTNKGRWIRTPMEEAERAGQADVIDLIRQAVDARSRTACTSRPCVVTK